MLERIANYIGRYMAAEGICAEDNFEVMSYGLFILLSEILQVAVLLVIALLLDITPYMLVFALFYGALRRYTGGAHAGSHLACLCIFTGTAVAACYAGLLLPETAGGYISSFLSLFAVAAVFLRAPIAHPNNPKSAKSLARFKRIGRIVVVAECAAVLISCAAPAYIAPYTNCAGLGCGIAALTLLPPVKNTEGKEGNTHEKV